MIYVDKEDLNVSSSWEKKSEGYLDELKNEVEEDDRTEYIENRSYHWSALKEELKSVSGGKCWYSEAKARANDFHVDHFRPKGRARQLDDSKRIGYWWLSFDWRNYRLAGSYPNTAHNDDDENTRGKRDYFPLRDPENAATDPSDPLGTEEPLFLDPTIEQDAALISFDESGKVRANTASAWEKSRVKKSVEYYYLDNPELKDGRKQVWQRTERKVESCKLLLQCSGDYPPQVLENQVEDLRDMVCSCYPLAGTARACVRQFIDTTEETNENEVLMSLLRQVLEFAEDTPPKTCPHSD